MLAELGEVTVNVRDAMQAHERLCPACRAARERQQRMLCDLARAPALAASADEFVTEVMARCAGEDGTASPSRGTRRGWLPWTAGLLVAAATLLAIVPALRDEPSEQLRARGGLGQAVASASADVFVARGKTLLRLGGAALSAGDRLAVRVANPTSQSYFFMAFAIDAAGDVHWLFPDYTDAATDPAAPELAPRLSAHVLPEMVELESPARGRLRVVSMVSARRMRVKEVEGRLASLPAFALARVFPESVIREWSCTWRDR